jgi:gamma-glutamylcyclotransferase (GGCT)/AIG2-like uncharacterized protein YtfP
MGDHGVYKLFVYGSLRSGFRSPVYEYITRFFEFAGEGKVKGKLFDMGEYPAAIPATDDYFIVGELYTAKNESEFSWAMAQLDDYEGINVEPGEPKLYRREIAGILINGQVVDAWIYWFNGDTTGKQVIESGDIIQYMKEKK